MSLLVAFSYKLRRLCPTCHQKRELLWAEWAEQELLEDVPHGQVVFTIPKRLRLFLGYDRKLLGELAACAWRTLKLYFEAYSDGAEVSPGAIGFLQTAGEPLNFHPHVHVLVTDGGFAPDGAFRPLAWFHSQRLILGPSVRSSCGRRVGDLHRGSQGRSRRLPAPPAPDRPRGALDAPRTPSPRRQ